MANVKGKELSRTVFVICPHCGNEDRDSWEIDFGPCNDGEATVDCGRCGKSFYAIRHCDISYSTSEAKP